MVLLVSIVGYERRSAMAGDPKQVGQWLDPFPIDNVAVHASLLPTGKVLCWGRRTNPMSVISSTMNEHKTVPFLLDTKDQICVYTKDRPTQLDNAGNEVYVNIFCSGHCFQPNGNLFVVGGHLQDGDGAQQACVYNPFKDEWTAKAIPNNGRWYPSALTLPDGKVFTISGSHDNSVMNNVPQIWQEGQNSRQEGWLTVSSPEVQSSLYPRLHLAPDGLVFVAGPQRKSQFLDLNASAPAAAAGSTPSPIGVWLTDMPVKKIPVRDAGERQYGSSAIYDAGKIIWTGGGNAEVRDSSGNIVSQDGGPPTNRTEIIDLNDGNPQWKPAMHMIFSRRQHNATTLPDGTVLVTGGTQLGGFNNLGTGGPVHTAELWNPPDGTSAEGSWTAMADETSDRCYHSVALLLPSGEVLSAGSGEGGGPAVPDPPKCNLTNAQLYRPPYLSKGKQPIISGVPQDWTVKYGQVSSVTVEQGESIARVSWIRLGSVTHGMNMNQALWNQKLEPARSGKFDMQAPDNRNVAPPGHYMVFFLNSQGVPSVAPIAKILPDTTAEERTPGRRASSTAADAVPLTLRSRRVAISNPARNTQIIEEQNKPAVVVGLTPVCPYGLGPCWGGASEGLKSIKDVAVVRPVPDQANSLAFVYLKKDILPDIDVWRKEFAGSANGSYGMRGIEMTIPGVVTMKRVGANEVLTLASTTTRPEVVLTPYLASSTIEWNMDTQAPQLVTALETGAYASLASVIAQQSAGLAVEVTGPLQKQDMNKFSLDVRHFARIDGLNTSSRL
ncbi:hypothetical protein LTR97_010556 [Elasticomyces elasticus]|uniref:Galactose oxidase-like Early set domain-containing protein n=1 Tax=Elasticomyces elasticus TaxID=574655 RepID=A0AAN7VMA1_9PEZI|nr:hypothetical protein LTR97_010556 [Elasticomyces elasticus]